MSEKLCLQWNDFQENIKSAFGNLRDDNDFADVTLACEDGQQMEAHKVILATSSPFFQKLLARNKHTHPLIFMRGMKSQDLLAIIDFLYRGEANVFQENLESFLAIAEELQLKGLMGETVEKVQDYKPDGHLSPTFTPTMNTNTNISKPSIKSSEIYYPGENRSLSIPGNFYGDLEELKEKVRSMMDKSKHKVNSGGLKSAYMCKTCGKEGVRNQIEHHIEANHLEGIIIPCNFCEKTCNTQHAMRQHKAKHHTNQVQ